MKSRLMTYAAQLGKETSFSPVLTGHIQCDLEPSRQNIKLVDAPPNLPSWCFDLTFTNKV